MFWLGVGGVKFWRKKVKINFIFLIDYKFICISDNDLVIFFNLVYVYLIVMWYGSYMY